MPQRYFLIDEHTLSPQDEHHIRHVMRMTSNDQIIVCFQGVCHQATLVIDNQHITFSKDQKLPTQQTLDITIIQGLPKGTKIDFVTKSASLFGAKKVIFVPMQHSIAKLDNMAHKLKRLESIAKEACELAHRETTLKIAFEKDLKSIDFKAFDAIYLADENEKETGLKKILSSDHKTLHLAFIIGPEGGLSQAERQQLESWGIKPISLGELILPTEYAHLYILSYLRAHYL